MTTVIMFGGQPFVSEYVTVNRNVVAVEPEPGDADPPLSATLCGATEQLAAVTAGGLAIPPMRTRPATTKIRQFRRALCIGNSGISSVDHATGPVHRVDGQKVPAS